MIDRFYDGDKSNSIPVNHPELHPKTNYNGGDLQGVLQKLQEGYFESLGINTLWISPVIQNTNNAYQEYPAPHRFFTAYHGYWPVHPTNVEEKFGDMDLLKKLISEAKSKNIKVLLDYVANHIHIEHPFWDEHRDWFGTLELPDGRKNLRLWDEHRLTTWFEPYMPSFDYSGSPEALNFMTDNAVWWLKETGAAGFRHDAVKHVPNTFWRELTRKIKEEIEIPNSTKVYQIGETFGSYELVNLYINNGQLDAQFNFNLYDTAVPVFSDPDASFRFLDDQLKKTFSVFGENNLMGNVMDSHDKTRFMAYADGDITNDIDPIELGWENPPVVDNKSSYKKLKLYMAYMMSIPGIPVVYYGDEIGMTGAADPDNRRMMRFDADVSDIEKETMNEVSRIIKTRTNHSALRYGDFHTLFVEDDAYAYIRSDMNERIIVVFNKSESEKLVELKIPEYYKIKELKSLNGFEDLQIKNNSVNINLEPLSFRFYRVDF
jgi:cyclomaltodextrinase / maltogenic alpha-amylase / neopullulanase